MSIVHSAAVLKDYKVIWETKQVEDCNYCERYPVYKDEVAYTIYKPFRFLFWKFNGRVVQRLSTLEQVAKWLQWETQEYNYETTLRILQTRT